MADILVADDDGHIREVVRYALEHAGHRVREARDGREALAQHEAHAPDLVVLDVLMPEQDGLSVCKAIRSGGRTPIIFLSSRDEELDRVLGLDMGADDYMTKPFSPRELVSRVAAVLRRASGGEGQATALELSRDGLTMRPASHAVHYNEQPVPLTATEFALLLSLLKAPGRVFSRPQLASAAHGSDHHISDRTVDSHVRRIRRKLSEHGPDPIETVYGVGYKLRG